MMMLSLTAFSQTGTVQVPTKCLPIVTLQMISQDLLRGDEAKAQLKLTEGQLDLTEKKVIVKDSIISTMKVKESNYVTIIDVQNQKYGVLENYTKKIEWDLKKEKVKGKFLNIMSGGIVIALTALLIVR
jgi:hypothetical protein